MTINMYNNEPKCDDNNILQFALFLGYCYMPPLGVDSLFASADTVEELKNLPEIISCDEYNVWQIINTSTFRITDAGDAAGPTIVNGINIPG